MISKKITKHLFLQNNSLVLNLPDLNPKGLYMMLKKKGYTKEAKMFLKEGINGNEFILMMSNLNGMPILEQDFKLSFDEIERLKKFYIFIFKLRRVHHKQLFEKEIPYYI